MGVSYGKRRSDDSVPQWELEMTNGRFGDYMHHDGS